MDDDSILKPTPQEPGIKCPRCNCADLRVESTRPLGSHIQRKRVCRHCATKFYTTEKVIFKQ